MDEFRLTPDKSVDESLRDEARKIFLPSRPITMREALRGRAREVDRALETLATPGRSVFVYGERGVGKTSLAQTTAYLVNTAEQDPIFLACHRRSTFGEIVTQIIRKLSAFGKVPGIKRVVTEASLSASPVGHILRRIEEHPDEHLTKLDPNLAVDLFNEVCPARLAGKVVVLLDEIDTIGSPEVRGDLAYLIKQVGDRDCAVKFIFAGIGETIDKLLQEHQSASRYMATIKLDRLSLEELKDIVVLGLTKLDISIHESFAWRISCISDGFAHFTHLIALKLAMRCINESRSPRKVDARIFAHAVEDAIEDSEGWLKHAYDNAVKKYQDVYEPVLWAAADHWELHRSTDQIYQSYCRICGDVGRQPEEKRSGFYNRLNRLRQEAHGPALVSPRKSWYQFRDTMLRGYCRLVAESQNVQIGIDYGGSRPNQPPPR